MEIDRLYLQELLKNVAEIALLPFLKSVIRDYKSDGSVITHVDNAIQDLLTQQLAEKYPDILLLGEEMSVEQQAGLINSGQAIWCLDPVDGTSNFASGLPLYGISLALIEQGEVTFGIVFDPIRNESFTAIKGQGAWLNDEPLTLKNSGLKLSQSLAFIDFKRLSPDLAFKLIQNRPYASQRSLGTVALELCWLAAGRAHIYLHGSQNIWDYAAADLILKEAGGFASTLEGENSFSCSLQARSGIAATDKSLFDALQAYLKS